MVNYKLDKVKIVFYKLHARTNYFIDRFLEFMCKYE